MKLEDFKPNQRVVYLPLHADGNLKHPDVEWGTVSSIGSLYVFVRFDKQVEKFGWDGATSQCCSPHDLLIGEKG